MLKQDAPLEEHKPMMSDECISLIEKELLAKGKNLSILEWGSGGSTIYFPRFLVKNNVNFRWDSIEHDPRWYCNVQDINNLSQVKLHLFMVSNPADKKAVKRDRLKQYVNFPRSLNRQYDVIFVDGRKRNECLEIANRFIKKDGIVFLHDAQRKKYEKGIKIFNRNRARFLTEDLWMAKK